jgi:hypothetical protein
MGWQSDGWRAGELETDGKRKRDGEDGEVWREDVIEFGDGEERGGGWVVDGCEDEVRAVGLGLVLKRTCVAA